MSVFRPRLLSSVVLAVLATGCPPSIPPGDQPLGVYAMNANEGELGACELSEVNTNDFGFEATLTRESTSSRAWVTLVGYSREGTFDGQYFSSTGEANRIFAACSECKTRLVETLTVAMLSRSQSDAVGGQCPPNALDGGVPLPNDAGVTGPQETAQGFDAVRLCGELTTVVVADGLPDGGPCEAKCSGCPVRYQLRGERR